MAIWNSSKTLAGSNESNSIRDMYNSLKNQPAFDPTYNGNLGGSLGGYSPSPVRPSPGAMGTHGDRVALLEARMRAPFTLLESKLPGLNTTFAEGKVFVHFVRNGELQVFEDEPSMFPSDALVNNLRLCL